MIAGRAPQGRNESALLAYRLIVLRGRETTRQAIKTGAEALLTTRQQILSSAAVLFAGRGYYGTSTREIAARVGISQPSLFHHFASKVAILEELLRRDLAPALDRMHRCRACPGSAGARLYAYLVDDVTALVDSPFDARGLYHDEVLLEDGLADLRDSREQLHRLTRELIAEGVASGEFRPVDPGFAQQTITALLLDTIWVAGVGLKGNLPDRPHQVADFVLLGLLGDPGTLPGVRVSAEEVRRVGCVGRPPAWAEG